jgi:hypothetical protein
MTQTEVAEAPVANRGPGYILAVSLAVLFGLVAIVLGAVLANDDDGGALGITTDSGIADLQRAAGQFTEALLTYDHRDPDAHRDAVLGLATGSFTEEYEDSFEHGLRQLMTQVQASSQGTVKDIFLSEVDEGRAELIVVADAVQDGAGGPRTVYDLYVKLTMVQVDGRWKVDDVVDLNFTGGGLTVPAGESTSTTAASGETPVP